jgi:flagellar biosynthesis protein FlhF
LNVKRFTARNSREALRLVREALGDDAVVVSTKPSAGGVEVVAMPPETIGRLEAMSTEQAAPEPAPPLSSRRAQPTTPSGSR